MELGEKIKQARLETGLSQRQLCEDTITRNMLSQIENGKASPSMDTLRLLAQRLGKPVSYFLDESAESDNQRIITRSRTLPARQVLELLENYRSPDPVFDPERYLLEAVKCMELAQLAIEEKRMGYALALLEQAKQAGEQTIYYTAEQERRRLLLCYAAGEPADKLISELPDNTDEILLRAQAEENLTRRGQILDTASARSPAWHYLRAEVYFAQADYSRAAELYLQAAESKEVFARLEHCYRELQDFKNAYFYACKRR